MLVEERRREGRMEGRRRREGRKEEERKGVFIGYRVYRIF